METRFALLEAEEAERDLIRPAPAGDGIDATSAASIKQSSMDDILPSAVPDAGGPDKEEQVVEGPVLGCAGPDEVVCSHCGKQGHTASECILCDDNSVERVLECPIASSGGA